MKKVMVPTFCSVLAVAPGMFWLLVPGSSCPFDPQRSPQHQRLANAPTRHEAWEMMIEYWLTQFADNSLFGPQNGTAQAASPRVVRRP